MIEGKPVRRIGDGAFSSSQTVTSVTLPDSITAIGNSAFSGCRIMNSMIFPEGITSIGSFAFQGCERQVEVILPSGLASLGKGVFSGCRQLRKVVVPAALGEIPTSMFRSCENLESVELPRTVTRIGGRAFSSCRSLSKIRLPDGLVEIGPGAFGFCHSLGQIRLPDSVTSIGGSAFLGSGLRKVVFNNGLRSIGSRAFERCEDLASAVIPASVSSMGDSAFLGCPSLPSAVFLGDAPRRMGKGVFGKQGPGFKLFFAGNARGFTFPKWAGYKVSLPDPEISVEVGDKPNVDSEAFLHRFGIARKGSRGSNVLVTVSNAGTRPLRNLSVELSGSAASDFRINGKARKFLKPGKSTTFTITFKPKVRGKRRAELAITSNDSDENPFEVKLRGVAVELIR